MDDHPHISRTSSLIKVVLPKARWAASLDDCSSSASASRWARISRSRSCSRRLRLDHQLMSVEILPCCLPLRVDVRPSIPLAASCGGSTVSTPKAKCSQPSFPGRDTQSIRRRPRDCRRSSPDACRWHRRRSSPCTAVPTAETAAQHPPFQREKSREAYPNCSARAWASVWRETIAASCTAAHKADRTQTLSTPPRFECFPDRSLRSLPWPCTRRRSCTRAPQDHCVPRPFECHPLRNRPVAALALLARRVY